MTSQLEHANMSADDSFDSDCDNSSPDPINEIESNDDNRLDDRMGVRPYRFEPRRIGGGVNLDQNDPPTVNEFALRGEEDLSWFVLN